MCLKEAGKSFVNFMRSVQQLLGEPFHEAQSERFTDAEVYTVRAGLSDLYPRAICDPEKSRIWSQSWFDQYKMLEQSTESIVSRRQETHKFFMASLTALLAGSLILVARESGSWLSGVSLCFVGVIGFFLTLVWHRLYRNYCRSIKRKLLLIEALQTYLPLSLNKLQHDLHELLPAISNDGEKKFRAISDAERIMPSLFGYLSLLILVAGVTLFHSTNQLGKAQAEVESRLNGLSQAQTSLSMKLDGLTQVVDAITKAMKANQTEQERRLDVIEAETHKLGSMIQILDKHVSTMYSQKHGKASIERSQGH